MVAEATGRHVSLLTAAVTYKVRPPRPLPLPARVHVPRLGIRETLRGAGLGIREAGHTSPMSSEACVYQVSC